MSDQINRIRLTALTAGLLITLGSATELDAAPTDLPLAPAAVPQIAQQIAVQPIIELQPPVVAGPLVQPVPDITAEEARPASAAKLAALVTAQSQPADLPRELNCLAGAVYFEAKSEALTGQLAVGRVIVARSKSGRFPNSYCGVVYQPSQFSFVRGSAMPAINTGSRGWKNAVAIAQIAHEGSWQSPVEGALFFHAARVSPRWHASRIAQIGNHIFYH